jgi:predicted secreted protein
MNLRSIIGGMIALCAGSASAGDFAHFQSLGFSEDGRVYAFEEYGVQDGSGFPYSNIYFIDTEADRFLPSTPVRTRLKDEQQPLAQARRQSRATLKALFEKFDLDSNPGELVAFNPVTEIGPDGNSLRYLSYPAQPAVGKPYTLRLDTVSLPVPAPCNGMMETAAGFRLTMTEKDGAKTSLALHEDKSIPASRGCAQDYRLGGVVVFAASGGKTLHMVLIQVLSRGFEGSDGRWIALPVHP